MTENFLAKKSIIYECMVSRKIKNPDFSIVIHQRTNYNGPNNHIHALVLFLYNTDYCNVKNSIAQPGG